MPSPESNVHTSESSTTSAQPNHNVFRHKHTIVQRCCSRRHRHHQSRPNRAQYRVHTDIISPASAYFERAFLNGIELKLSGGATDVDFFNVFIDWLYSRKIPAGLNQNVLLKAVVCGHFITAPAFEAAVQNKLVDTVIAERKAPSHPDIIFVFDKLPADHALLELFMELHSCWGVESPEQMRMNPEMPFDFIRRIYDKGLKTVDVLAGNPLQACDYHVHATEEERWMCVYGSDS